MDQTEFPSAKVITQPSDPPAALQAPWSRRQMSVGLRFFLALSLLVVVVLFLRGKLRDNLDVLLSVSTPVLCIALAQSLADLLAGGLRLWILARAFGSRVDFISSVRANGANIFVGGLTPSQTGGGPAQIYVLARSGLSLPVSLVTSFIAYVGTIVTLIVFGLIMIWRPPVAIVAEYRAFLGLGATFLGSFLLLLGLALPNPRIYRNILQRLCARIPVLGAKFANSKLIHETGMTLETASQQLRLLDARRMLILLAGAFMSVLIYFNKFLMAYVVMRGLGLQPELLQVIFLQWVLYLALYFAPTPGASGIAELSAFALMAPILPKTHEASFVLLWRTFSLYVPIALGGVAQLLQRGGSAPQPRAQEAGTAVPDPPSAVHCRD